MALTHKRIAQLAEKPGVKTKAVENFLFSLGSDERAARANLQIDASLYRWNLKTIDAIRQGINEAFE